MDEIEQQKLIDKVVNAALEIRLVDALGASRQPRSSSEEGNPEQPISYDDVKRAKADAEKLIRNPAVLERLCPALTSISRDLETTAKTVGTVLLTMAVGPTPIVTLNVLAFGAVAVMVLRAGVNTICPQQK